MGKLKNISFLMVETVWKLEKKKIMRKKKMKEKLKGKRARDQYILIHPNELHHILFSLVFSVVNQ